MEPLYNQTGQVYAWLDDVSGRIIDLRGQHVAFLSGSNVYTWKGAHMG